MTGAREAAQVMLVRRHLIELLNDAEKDDKAAAVNVFDVGDKKVATLKVPDSDDELPLGKVELRDGGTSVDVTDHAALLAWVREEHAGWLTVAPDTDPLKDALLACRKGNPTPEQLALVVDAANQHYLDQLKIVGGQFSRAQETALLANITENKGAYRDPDTGRLEEVPGVTFTHLPPKPVITIDRKGGAKELVAELITGGQLPPLPAIEG